MTEEVTDAMLSAGWDAMPSGRTIQRWADLAPIYLAMRSASNSPTTNGEEYQQARTAYLDEFVGEWPGKRPIAANAYDAGYSRANLTPRAAPNSPTTNGEVIEPGLQSDWRDADGEGAAVVRSLTPRAASDDEVERVARMLDGLFGPIIHCDSGDRLDWTDVVRAAIAALSTPTTDSAVDDPEAAKGAPQ